MRFGIVGVAGYIAPRHLAAIQDVRGEVVVAHDIADHARVLDEYFPDASFFTDLDRMERHLRKDARGGRHLDYVSICSPNFLHDAHILFSLRNGADAICEKPVVINPWNLDVVCDEQERTGRMVWTILQLRLLPELINLRERVRTSDVRTRFSVDLTYVTERGRWYFNSWKGDEQLSGGIITNIGIHLFDLLEWIFGPVRDAAVQVRRPEVAAGTLRLERADVRWFLSVDAKHLPESVRVAEGKSFRALTVNGEEIDFTDYGAVSLHTVAYQQIIAGNGFGIEAARSSIELTHRARTTPLSELDESAHALAQNLRT